MKFESLSEGIEDFVNVGPFLGAALHKLQPIFPGQLLPLLRTYFPLP